MRNLGKGRQADRNQRERYLFWLIAVILCFILVYLYGRNVFKFSTVWELGDEAGYLWNAAFFSHTDWDSFASVYSYYGYGYSLLLTPLFFIVDSGVELLWGTYIINIVLVVGTYWLLIKLLNEVNDGTNKIIFPFIALTACLIPYVASNVYKVFCEIFFMFAYTLLVLLVHLLLKNGKKYSLPFILCAIFMFFIHTRAVVVLGISILCLIFIWKQNWKQNLKTILVCVISSVITFALLYYVKGVLISYKDSVRRMTEEIFQEANLLSVDYFIERISWFNPLNYFFCFLAKVFYVINATAFTIVPALVIMVKSLINKIKSKQKLSAKTWTLIYVYTTLALYLIACTMLGTGSDAKYIFYGRYYEFIMPVVIIFNLYLIIFEGKEYLSKTTWLKCIAVPLALGIIVSRWCASFAQDLSVVIDTNRLDAFSKAIKEYSYIDDVLIYIAFCGLLLSCVYYYLTSISKTTSIILLVAVVYVWQSSWICIDQIQKTHEVAVMDTQIATYIRNNIEDEKVYMIDDNSYRYPYFYSRMQVLLKDIKLNVISPDQSGVIEDGAYVMIYSTNPDEENMLDIYDFIMKGRAFYLYQK